MNWTDNPFADADRYDAQQQAQLDKLPKCECCGKPIQQDDAVYIEDYGVYYCDECLADMRRGIEI